MLDGSCRTPIAGYASIEHGRIAFSGMVLTPDGAQAHEIGGSGMIGDAAEIGRDAGERLRAKAGPGFLAGWD